MINFVLNQKKKCDIEFLYLKFIAFEKFEKFELKKLLNSFDSTGLILNLPKYNTYMQDCWFYALQNDFKYSVFTPNKTRLLEC